MSALVTVIHITRVVLDGANGLAKEGLTDRSKCYESDKDSRLYEPT